MLGRRLLLRAKARRGLVVLAAVAVPAAVALLVARYLPADRQAYLSWLVGVVGGSAAFTAAVVKVIQWVDAEARRVRSGKGLAEGCGSGSTTGASDGTEDGAVHWWQRIHRPENQSDSVNLAGLGTPTSRESLISSGAWQGADARRIAQQPGATLPTAGVTAYLPPRLASFVGREGKRRDVVRFVKSRRCTVIHGMPGIGKTALAIEVAHGCLAEGVFDAVVWVDARYRSLRLGEVVHRIATVVGSPVIDVLDPRSKVAAVEGLLARGRYLIVVDSYESIDDESVDSFLHNLPFPTKVLITSRCRLSMDAALVHLTPMSHAEGESVVRAQARVLAVRWVEERTSEELAALVDSSGGVPQVLSMAVGEMQYTGTDPSGVSEGLRAATGDYYRILGAFLDACPASSARMLEAMSIFVAPVTKAALTAVTGLDHAQCTARLWDLVGRSLVATEACGPRSATRYSLHPATRTVAHSRLTLMPATEEAARSRAARFFLGLIESGFNASDLRRYRGQELDAENTKEILDWCYSRQEWCMFVRLERSLREYLWMQGAFVERLKYAQQAARASRESGDRSALASASTAIADTLLLLGPTGYQRAAHALDEALALFLELDDKLGAEEVLYEKARLARKQGRSSEARQCARAAIDLSTLLAEDRRLGYAINCLANIEYDQGNLDLAEDLYRGALDTFALLRDDLMIGVVMRNQARVARDVGRSAAARGLYSAAGSLFAELALPMETAQVQQGLAVLEMSVGNEAKATDLALQARATFSQIGAQSETAQIDDFLQSQQPRPFAA